MADYDLVFKIGNEWLQKDENSLEEKYKNKNRERNEGWWARPKECDKRGKRRELKKKQEKYTDKNNAHRSQYLDYIYKKVQQWDLRNEKEY